MTDQNLKYWGWYPHIIPNISDLKLIWNLRWVLGERTLWLRSCNKAVLNDILTNDQVLISLAWCPKVIDVVEASRGFHVLLALTTSLEWDEKRERELHSLTHSVSNHRTGLMVERFELAQTREQIYCMLGIGTLNYHSQVIGHTVWCFRFTISRRSHMRIFFLILYLLPRSKQMFW